MNDPEHAFNARSILRERIETAHKLLLRSLRDVAYERAFFAGVCRGAHERGISDREIAEITGYSRTRIQQIRTETHGEHQP